VQQVDSTLCSKYKTLTGPHAYSEYTSLVRLLMKKCYMKGYSQENKSCYEL
jgi:hypothetical protein